MVNVLHPGFYTSVQDFGRFGYEAFGVPLSGVMDTYAASFANAILGNAINTPVLEITMQGPRLAFECNTLICISGADLAVILNDVIVESNVPVPIRKGDILSFGKLFKGFRCYLSVLGGFKTPCVLGSFSMYQGITAHYKLRKGDRLPVHSYTYAKAKSQARVRFNMTYLEHTTLEVIKGPEFDKLNKTQKDLLCDIDFSISKYNNRMAYQLTQPLENNLKPILTSLVLPGTVQLTPSGRLIVLMKDCQITGGYPRVLQLSAKAINVIAQCFTGSKISFKLK